MGQYSPHFLQMASKHPQKLSSPKKTEPIPLYLCFMLHGGAKESVKWPVIYLAAVTEAAN